MYNGIASLKYFCEQMPQLHVAVAGSLLGITLRKGESFPVGKVDVLSMYPMTYMEYLMACDKKNIVQLPLCAVLTCVGFVVWPEDCGLFGVVVVLLNGCCKRDWAELLSLSTIIMHTLSFVASQNVCASLVLLYTFTHNGYLVKSASLLNSVL